jgi:hypothetical protein
MDDVLAALGLESWYVVGAPIQAGIIQAARKSKLVGPLWRRIPSGWRFLPGVVVAAAIAYGNALAKGMTPVSALPRALGGILGLALPAMGIAAGLRESHVPWDGGAGGKPREEAPVP